MIFAPAGLPSPDSSPDAAPLLALMPVAAGWGNKFTKFNVPIRAICAKFGPMRHA